MCHGETSTGVLTPIDRFRKVADEFGALLVVDAVATLCGVPLDVDRQRIDLCFSGTQKAISAPPGMAPITVGPRMEEVLRDAQDAGAELVLRSDHDDEFLGQGPHLSPHAADFASCLRCAKRCASCSRKGWKQAGSGTARISWR